MPNTKWAWTPKALKFFLEACDNHEVHLVRGKKNTSKKGLLPTILAFMALAMVLFLILTRMGTRSLYETTPWKKCDVTSRTLQHENKAVVCVIVRDEVPYVEEWVDYNLQVLNFSAIFIYDNSDDDKIKQWAERIMDPRVVVVDHPGRKAQPRAFQACTKRAKSQGFDFAFFADTDEYLALFSEKHHDVMDFVADYFSKTAFCQQGKCQPTGAVCMNWRILGTNGEDSYTPVPLSKRFQLRVIDDYRMNFNMKCIARLDALNIETVFTDPHNLPLKKGWRKINTKYETLPSSHSVPVHNIAAIYHYYFKSKAEYLRKRLRGGGTLGPVESLINEAMRGIDHFGKPLPVGIVRDDFVWKALTCHVPKYQENKSKFSKNYFGFMSNFD